MFSISNSAPIAPIVVVGGNGSNAPPACPCGCDGRVCECARPGWLGEAAACDHGQVCEGQGFRHAGSRSQAHPHQSLLGNFLASAVYYELVAAVAETNTNNLILENEMSNITGATYLGDEIRKRVDAAKQRASNALSRADGAFTKFDGAAGQVEKVAEQVEREADDLLAQIGQISNMPPDGPY